MWKSAKFSLQSGDFVVKGMELCIWTLWVSIRRSKGLCQKPRNDVQSANEGWSSSKEEAVLPSLFPFYCMLVTSLPRMGLLHSELCWTYLVGHCLLKLIQSIKYHISRLNLSFWLSLLQGLISDVLLRESENIVRAGAGQLPFAQVSKALVVMLFGEQNMV